MTAFDLIREGTVAWAGGLFADGGTDFLTIILLFVTGFMFAALISHPRRCRPVANHAVATTACKVCEEQSNDIAASKESLNRLTEALTVAFADLSGGLVIFDADKTVHLFNPALADLFDLDPVWLAARPGISDFIAKLRENRNLPEKKKFLEWRRLMTKLLDAEHSENYVDEWVLPDGRVLRVAGKPYPRGAVAFSFEDISAHVEAERNRRTEVAQLQNVLNGIPDGIVLLDSFGAVKVSNTAFDELFEQNSSGISNYLNGKLFEPQDFWTQLRRSASVTSEKWAQVLYAGTPCEMIAEVSPLPERMMLVVFRRKYTSEIPQGLIEQPLPIVLSAG